MREQLPALGRIGFIYDVEVVRHGVIIDRETVKNLIPLEGLNDILAVYFAGAAAHPAWFLGIFEGNYTPVTGDTAGSFPLRATESTAYSETARVAWQHDPVASGTIINATNRAEFTMSAAKTIYGAFLTPSSTKSDTSGVLASCARFTVPKGLDVGDILRVTAGLTLTSN